MLHAEQPNVIFVFGDQWRMQATGYAGDPNVHTPHLDVLARESIHFTHAVSGCPVCSPYRASLLTGQRPLTHGVFVNDVSLRPQGTPLGTAFKEAGYETAYIGKWHVDGQGRSNCIPPERRCGFEYWNVLECTHDYNHSAYYAGDDPRKRYWEGYDALAQTEAAMKYVRRQASAEKPFLLALSWGPPHSPYDTAPAEFRSLYDARNISLRPNVPDEIADNARRRLAGYYAHCSALDDCMGRLLHTLGECGIEDNTLLVFTSDHGDMLGSQGHANKQRPWDESIRVPFLLRYPGLEDWRPRECNALIDAPDIMPTLLGLAGLAAPGGMQGLDYSGYLRGEENPSDGAVLLTCPHPFGQWQRVRDQGREYRGLRTERFTYVRDLQGPWLLYDNENDPFQMQNRIDDPAYRAERKRLEEQLHAKLRRQEDAFLPGMEYVRKWGYRVDATGTVPYEN